MMVMGIGKVVSGKMGMGIGFYHGNGWEWEWEWFYGMGGNGNRNSPSRTPLQPTFGRVDFNLAEMPALCRRNELHDDVSGLRWTGGDRTLQFDRRTLWNNARILTTHDVAARLRVMHQRVRVGQTHSEVARVLP